MIEMGYEGDTSYWDIKKWLWERHKIYSEQRLGYKEFLCQFRNAGSSINILVGSDSPITAEIEGIKVAINHLHKQL